jgi:hypothetical protein
MSFASNRQRIGFYSRFRSWQKQHPNFITPHLIKTKRKDDEVIELSEGDDFENKSMYGVSVIKITPEGFKPESATYHDTGRSKSFIGADARKNAIKYFKEI